MFTKFSRPAILVLYHLRGVAQLPLRRSIEDHLLCWSRHSRHPVIYHNYAFGFDWREYADLPICAVLFDTLALNIRWDPDFFLRKAKPLGELRHFSGPKVAMPQDEFIHTDVLCDFLGSIGATHLMSCAPPEVAERIYRPKLPLVRLRQKLTGYVEEETLKDVERLAAGIAERDIDVGYRAWRAEPWLGRHGHLKARLADEAVAAGADLPHIRMDVSTSEDAVLRGDDWFRFLLRCRATLGAEGGASVLDRDGTIRARTRAYVAAHPAATFDEVRQACFAAEDGKLELFAIGPRHIEACTTRTCQLLVEGAYQGILRPGVDYIPIARDFSNIRQVLRSVMDHDRMRRTAGNAYDRVVRSRRFTYRGFVRATERAVIPLRHRLPIHWSRADARAIEQAMARHSEIWEFARHEALHLLPNRVAYEWSEDPAWAEERRNAAALAARTKIELSPD